MKKIISVILALAMFTTMVAAQIPGDLDGDDVITVSDALRAMRIASQLDPYDAAADVDFTPNEQSKRLLKRINDRRSYLDRKLREGDVIFFGSRYASVSVTPRLARDLLAILPEAIRESSDGADLFGKMRGKGITYMTREICDELVENRADYSQIVERRTEMEKADELNKLLQQGVR